MRKLFSILLFFSSTATFAATGTGHAQAALSQPLVINHYSNVNFGTVSIDPNSGTQTINIHSTYLPMSCPSTYVCAGDADNGAVIVHGAPDTQIHLSLAGSTATLSNGDGQFLTFDPMFLPAAETRTGMIGSLPSNYAVIAIGGKITFTGNEVAGIYNTTNTGGSGYTVTVNY